jgi:DtxR family Mn-dependent transcriptional regulator
MSDEAEELLHELWVEKERTGVARVADPEGATELERLGLAERKQGYVVLTSAGEERARNVVRRHRLAERLIEDVTDVHEPRADEQLCRFYHHVHAGVEDVICSLLGHPRFCPHGEPIPPGPCCESASRERQSGIVFPLSEMAAGGEGEIAHLNTTDLQAPQASPSSFQKLLSLGLMPGARIRVLQTFPSFVVRVGEGEVALDRETAAQILVRTAPIRRRRRLGWR